MGLLDRLERSLEALIEGRLRPLAGRVHPMEIAQAVAREMTSQSRVGVRNRYAPNVYRVHLHDDDADALLPIEGSIVGELREYLAEEARDRGLALCGPLEITLVRDASVPSGSTQVAWAFQEPPLGGSAPAPASCPPAREPTVPPFAAGMDARPPAGRAATPLPTPPPLPSQGSKSPPPFLQGEAGFALGTRWELRGDLLVLGRLPDSDLPVPDPEVSRRHALLRREAGSWSIEDAGSRHGTRVNGASPGGRQVLKPGDVIEVGSSRLRFRAG